MTRIIEKALLQGKDWREQGLNFMLIFIRLPS